MYACIAFAWSGACCLCPVLDVEYVLAVPVQEISVFGVPLWLGCCVWFIPLSKCLGQGDRRRVGCAFVYRYM